jgi:hypothetical protein
MILIGSTIFGSLIGGTIYELSLVSALRSIGVGLLTLMATIGAAFMIYVILSPRGVDIESQQEIAKRKRDLQAKLRDLRAIQRQLEDERTKPELRGAISQVYIKPPHDMFVLEFSLWNVAKTPTAIREFELEVFTDAGAHTGTRVGLEPYAYVPLFQLEEDKQPLGALDAYEQQPTQGYVQGQMARGRWLGFSVSAGFNRESEIRRVVLIALDIFDIPHKIVAEPPRMGRGRIIGRSGLFPEDDG